MADYKDIVCRIQYRDTANLNSSLIIASYAVNGVLTFVSSILLIFGLRNTTKNKKYTRDEKLMLTLSAVDILNTLVVPTSQAVLLRQINNFGCLEISIIASFRIWFLALTSLTFLMISCERFFTVLYDNKLCGKIIKDSYLVVCFTCIALISFGIAVSYGFIYATSSLYLQFLFYLVSACLTLVFLVLIIAANISMLVGTIRKLIKSTHRVQRNTQVENHITKTIVVISIAHVLLYTPCLAAQYYLSLILSKDNVSLVTHFHPIFMWCIVVRETNSGINAIIYILRNRKISKMYSSKINSLIEFNSRVRNRLVHNTTNDLSKSA